MTLASRLLHRARLLALFGSAVLVSGCSKKVTPPPPPPAPAPAPARPTVTLQANPTTINKGESSTLTWNSTDATQLSIDRKSTRLNSSHGYISYAVFCLKK